MSETREVDISVILPGFNEEDNIELAVMAHLRALKSAGLDHEIIVVNDCSTDRTGQIADAMATLHPVVRVLHNPVNLNVGISLLIGMRAARGRVVIHNAFDLPFDPCDIKTVVSRFDDADLVVVVRSGRDAHSYWRKVTSIVHHWLIRILFLVKIRDFNFIQAYKREVVTSLDIKAKSPAFVTPELIIRAARSGYKIREVPAKFHPRERGAGSFGRPRDIFWALADMMSFWIETIWSRRR